MRAPVRSSLANWGTEPSRQARESVHFSKEKKTAFVKNDKNICTRRKLYQRQQQSLSSLYFYIFKLVRSQILTG